MAIHRPSVIIPPPSHPSFPKIRDEMAQKFLKRLLRHHKIDLWDYQKRFLFPEYRFDTPYSNSDPYDIHRLRYVQLGGAKRIGKSMLLALRMESYLMVPGTQIRVYAPEYTLAERELNWLERLLWTGATPLADVLPWINNDLAVKRLDPASGNMEIRWRTGTIDTTIIARTWERRNAWVGEAIDLAIMSEPGLFPDIRAYNRYIKPNLADRNATCWTGGTIDNPWMYDIHLMCHDQALHPDMVCTCEVPRSANPHVWSQEDQDLADPVKGGTETANDFAINWLGQWGVFSEQAYERWDPSQVKVIKYPKWRAAKSIPPGWDHWLSLDTGRFCALIQFIANPRGDVVVIDEYTNYGYRAGQIHKTDTRGFQPWFKDAISDILRYNPNMELPPVIIDPTSQMKADVEHCGLGTVDAINAHDAGVHAVNELMALKQLHILRPDGGRPPYLLEQEVPRAKWAQTASGIGGKHRLQKGSDDDHCADALRYGCAFRPVAEPYTVVRKKSVVERDLEWDDFRATDTGGDPWGEVTPEDELEQYA